METLTPDRFEERLARFLFERSEEARAVRVGEKDTSEQAAIVRRYEDLFTRGQYAALQEPEQAAEGDEPERLFRLREACGGGVVVRELAEEADRLENDILACRVSFAGEELPLRTAQAKLAVLEGYDERDELGTLAGDASATFNDRRLELARRADALETELTGEPDAVRRSEETKGIDLRELSAALHEAARQQDESFWALRERWTDRVLGADREDEPGSHHIAYIRRMSPLAGTYTKERAVPVCLETLERLGFDLASDSRIRLDLDDRPQKNPRACVIASDPPKVVHLITRAQGGLHDYQALLHEAGHALHYAGCDPDLPYTFRRLARDHALTEIYSFLVESITREAGWHAAYFDLTEEEAAERAEGARFLEVLLFRRYAAKLEYELVFWSDVANAPEHATLYAENLRAAIRFRYRPDGYLADMDDGFYSADYLRAWIRSAQLRAYLRSEVGADWWERPETGVLLRDLFREGTRPSSEEVARRIGFDPLDTAPLLDELVVAS
ncbi:MAG TPA: hypothetical protein VHK22_04095 [Gaiellaceae bacterium]|jgi:hypothetical protein|nr:hypothetical protein [Gaiellaceae bacterium]